MRILVMGAGGMGGYFGGRLARAGEEVAFVARGEHLRALREHGLRVQSRHGDFHLPQVRAIQNPAEVTPVELVLFCVKSYDTEEAAELIRPVLGPQTAVLSLQNGIDNEEKLAAIFGPEHVLGGAAYIESAIAEPGVIAQTSRITRIVFGEMDGRITPRVERLHQVFTKAGIESVPTEDIRAALWRKFVLICAFNALTALTRSPIGAVVGFGPTRDLFVEAMTEVARLAWAQGVRLEEDIVSRSLAYTDGLHYDFRSSMQRDLEQGKPLEVEALNGLVVRLGQELGVPTPVNRILYALLKVQDERNGGRLRVALGDLRPPG